jgi:Flp pilus assembly protein TadG
VVVDRFDGSTVTVEPLTVTVAVAVAWKTWTTLPATAEPVHDDVAVQIRMYLPATAVTDSLKPMTKFVLIATLVVSSAGVVGVIVGAVPSTLWAD